ncbi:MAG TPA: hypothetical protein VNB06_03950 [Thermoanaerobaculia bacterium]|nr:hypothetical protein [Thermoanaerobaculia bacterium]
MAESFATSSMDFYRAVEEDIAAREIPDVRCSRVEFKESGIGSAGREYLRVERGDLAFDVCAAPFGRGFFFSWWLSRQPLHARWVVLLFFVVIVGGAMALPTVGGLILMTANSCLGLMILPLSPLAGVLAVVGCVVAARTGRLGPDEKFVDVPLIGWIYGRLFRPETYYSVDTTTMFQESVRRSVNGVIDGLFEAQGIRALTEAERKPTVRDLIK